MKVFELIKILLAVNQNAEVIMSKDAEGNGYSPLSDIQFEDNLVYNPESTYSGYTSYNSLTDELMERGYTEEDIYEDENSVPAVVFWPTN